jgi:Fe-S-cluster-containing hydrogenase component 2
MTFDMPSCGGCRTCELACSFHHTGEFIPTASSLKVLEKKEGPGYDVILKEEAEGGSYACDGCEGLEIPLCIEYCREMDDLYKILEDFEAGKSERQSVGPASKRGGSRGRK